MDNVADALGSNLKGSNQRLGVKTDHVQMGVELHTVTSNMSFDLGQDKHATFHLATGDTGILGDESVQGDFQVYNTNPYAFSTKNVYGDLPVIKVRFMRKKKDNDTAEGETTTHKHFRFEKPADIF
ncbi:hypothetical protein EGW08_022263, partial [Elysia chlorotica]